MEDRLASKALNGLGRFPERFATVCAGIIWSDIFTRAVKVPSNDSLVESRDIKTSCLAKLEEETKQKILHEPDSGNKPITDDSTTLYLD